jgi:hypothetical protein
MRTIPSTLNDGARVYVLVRPMREYSDGLADVALFEAVPQDDYQYTPSLDYLEGKVEMPAMIRIER